MHQEKKNTTSDREGLYIIIKGTINQEDMMTKNKIQNTYSTINIIARKNEKIHTCFGRFQQPSLSNS